MAQKLNVIHPKAHLGHGVEAGPFTTIAEHVEIGEGTWIGPNVTIMDYVRIGANCRIFPGAVIGAVPQDLKFQGEVSYVEIGNNVTIREYVTINRGTAASNVGVTRVGDNCLIMSYVHIAHDCNIKKDVILTSYVGLAGETQVDEHAIIGGASAAHQFTRIGTHAMISGGSMIGKDVPPYVLAGRRPLCYGGINVIGLRRRGFTSEQIERIHDIYRIIYQVGLNISDACRKVEEVLDPSEEREEILSFIRASHRGIIPYKVKWMEDE
ncbi:MAG: acyl-ACP--UDP-N-acetylglucosamine O-acyltransferase [Bacteroidales bacterium]|jgi:UDP-N-acetylglucosamine acyltransferase|nr:acyl-ACP--UDP-N-acetylglucosamine O-acyltransferase [Bacteroidales bacterium]MDD2823760.1 acyl-ACP--UDP-N-acetylglucosamine O-acyltransferase [Bacteroidales bacterium]MDD3100589.1 acyl-ACP--UDP-N-acetylglucosamine O-acyltransferase [Bacteroidales bacterium]MDD3639879.1 acyl-ACP--UDP-N-acetylglucosamine O-acyltransferase [Bacteroidales bacterium]MDD3944156.1 acyl-ACP--UDP-N-acetylglucosamine O-acyltransferase [Bacteroidales bacterium]